MAQDTQNSPAEEMQIEQNAQNVGHPPRVKALLSVVIVLGVLLVLGLVVVVGTIIKRLNSPEAAEAAAKSKRGFNEVVVKVPAGAQLVGTQTTADRLVLRLKDADGDMLLLMDVRKGLELGRIRLQPEN